MSDSATERIIELQKNLTIRLAELGFNGTRAANVVHRLAEITVLAKDLADESVPLFLEMSPEHRDAMGALVSHIKWDMDEIRDAISDLEADFIELMSYMQVR